MASPMVAPVTIEGSVPGKITFVIMVRWLSLKTRAESISRPSIVCTPFKVLMKTGQKAPTNMTNMDESLKVGSMTMA